MSTQKYWIWLSLKRDARKYWYVLLEKFGDIRRLYSADEKSLLEFGLPEKAARSLAGKELKEAEQVVEQCRTQDVHIITLEDADYPQRLISIDRPPLVLYVKGRLPDIDGTVCVSVVGTRRPTAYGIAAAESFADALAGAGCTVISGMALGIDSAANRSALKAGGSTVAVLGCGVDVCYPPSNRRLMDDIIAVGAVVSEYPPGTEPAPYHFPERNRIISGLSAATLVVEAPYGSGALITANYALEAGRDVFAVPGNIGVRNADGCHALIRDGAMLAAKPEHILEVYGLAAKPMEGPQILTERREPAGEPAEKPPLSEPEAAVLAAVEAGAASPDAVIEQTGLSTPEVMAAITMLELSGTIRREHGNIIKH